MKNNIGLIHKYNIQKANGDPVDPAGEYFILKLNSKDLVHRKACIEAILVYAEKIKDHLPQLSKELIDKYGKPKTECSIVGCDQEAKFYDHTDNDYCGDCMEKALDEDEGLSPEDFDTIESKSI